MSVLFWVNTIMWLSVVKKERKKKYCHHRAFCLMSEVLTVVTLSLLVCQFNLSKCTVFTSTLCGWYCSVFLALQQKSHKTPQQPSVHSSISEYVPISCLWHLAINPFVLTENGNPSYGSQFNFLKWLSSSQNSWALYFLANITQTEVNSVFVRDHFQPRINMHTLLHQNSWVKINCASCKIQSKFN